MALDESGSIEDSELSKDALIDLLGEDDEGEGNEKEGQEEKVKKTEAEDTDSGDVDDGEEDDEEDGDEDTGDDDEDKELEDDDDKLVTPVSRREILAKYPNLYKDFPYLEIANHRDQEYTELFATPAEAQEVKDRADSLDEFEGQLLAGDTKPVLKAIKESDPNAFKKVVDGYMQSLADVDTEAYHTVLGNVIKRAIMSMTQEADTRKDDKLKEAALLVNQFVFGSSTFTAPVTLASKTDSTEADALKTEREEFAKEQFETVRDDISSRIDNSLRSTVDRSIDPRDVMTPYVKKHAIKDVMARLDAAIEEDTLFSTILDKLWASAEKSKYNPASKRAIRLSYIARAKVILPVAIKQARREALKGLGARKSPKRSSTPRRSTESRPSSSSSNDGKGMKTVDFFNQGD